jgi:hypothetical protein
MRARYKRPKQIAHEKRKAAGRRSLGIDVPQVGTEAEARLIDTLQRAGYWQGDKDDDPLARAIERQVEDWSDWNGDWDPADPKA